MRSYRSLPSTPSSRRYWIELPYLGDAPLDEVALAAQHQVLDVVEVGGLPHPIALRVEHADLGADIAARVESQHVCVTARRAPLPYLVDGHPSFVRARHDGQTGVERFDGTAQGWRHPATGVEHRARRRIAEL